METQDLFRRSKNHTIYHIHDAVADLADDVVLYATIIPKGAQAQLFYDNFGLVNFRILRPDGQFDHYAASDAMFSHIPEFIKSEYLHAAWTGGFDLIGRMWVSLPAMFGINVIRRERGEPIFQSYESAIIEAFKLGLDYIVEQIRFTPFWSTALLGRRFFATYDNFLTALESDFPKLDSITTTVRGVDNITKLYNLVVDRINIVRAKEDGDANALPETDVIIIHTNDLTMASKSNLPKLTPSEVTTVEVPNDTISAILDHVEIVPDRFGRLEPSLCAITDLHEWPGYIKFTLPSIEELLKRGYREGDTVSVCLLKNRQPKVGKVLTVTDQKDTQIDEDLKYLREGKCPNCTEPLINKSDTLYCINDACSLVVHSRLLYACKPEVLNLNSDITYLVDHFVNLGTSRGITEFLTLGREQLSECLGDDDVEHMLKIFRKRHAQLHGHGYSKIVQNNTQGRFIDALSVRGLYRRHIQLLQQQLAKNAWRWIDLPSVLTDMPSLVRYGISRSDARSIVGSARRRLIEIDAFSKL